MDDIQSRDRIIELHYGKRREVASTFLERYNGEDVILSERDVRSYGVEVPRRPLELVTSTLIAIDGKRKTVKLILPRETGSRKLTKAARFGLGLIGNKKLVYGGVHLDDNGWGELKGDGVYAIPRDKWFKRGRGKDGVLIGLGSDMTEEQAGECPMVLAKLGHPDHVDSKFARSADEVLEIISKTFGSGEQEHGYDTMMGQHLPLINDRRVLYMCSVDTVENRARSNTRSEIKDGNVLFAFDRINNANSNVENVDGARAQFQNLECVLQPGQINRISEALDEGDELKRRLSKAEEDCSAISGERDKYLGEIDELRKGRLTPEKIYSRIEEHVPLISKEAVMGILSDLTSKSK